MTVGLIITSVALIVSVLVLDIAINVAFPYPTDHRRTANKFATYFEYGRSIEAKLRRIVQPTDEASHPVALVGWLDHICREAAPSPPGHLGMAVYGMSCSAQIAEAIHEEDPSVVPTCYGGPAAPPNHSYSCFVTQNQSQRDRNSVQVFGILASTVKGLLALGGATMAFERPFPFTFTRYVADSNERLVEIRPLVSTLEELRETLRDDVKWNKYINQLRQYDGLYDPLLMFGGLSDRSAILRMLRRAYGQHDFKRRTAKVCGGEGFGGHPQIGPVLRAMVLDFARRSRSSGQIPIVWLIHDRPYGDTLYRFLAPTLESNCIAYMSTHRVAPTSNPANFVPDGHFTHEANKRIGHEALEILRAAVSKVDSSKIIVRNA
jgi:hypothetical protein